jgi:hypothetical protein
LNKSKTTAQSFKNQIGKTLPIVAQTLKSWDQLSECFTVRLREDVKSVIVENVSLAAKLGQYDCAFRWFLMFLRKQDDACTETVIRSLQHPKVSTKDQAKVCNLIAQTVDAFYKDLRRSKTANTSGDYTMKVARVLSWLGAMESRRYPAFSRNMVVIEDPKGEGGTLSLGQLDWPELKGLRGAARERRAVDILSKEAAINFVHEEETFLFGQKILLHNEPWLGVDSKAFFAIKTLLTNELKSLAEYGMSQFSSKRVLSKSTIDILDLVSSQKTWAAAGLIHSGGGALFSSKDRGATRQEIAHQSLACIGPTYRAMKAVAGVFVCATGWNRASIIGLPEPYAAFQTVETCNVAAGVFLSVFKERAKHDVQAFLERGGRRATGLLSNNLLAHWDVTAGATDAEGAGRDHIAFENGADVISFLDRYATMAKTIRNYDLKHQYGESFFIYLNQRNGITLPITKVNFSENNRSAISSRLGVSFQAIRKSVVNLKVKEVGSLGAARSFAGHSATRVLQSHYANNEYIKQELDDSIRFFQNSLQSLVIGENKAWAIRLGLGAEDQEWFRLMCKISGIQATFEAPVNSSELPIPKTLQFNLTPKNYQDIFLIELALEAARERMGNSRWTVQALPMMACVQAIKAKLLDMGKGRAFEIACAEASRALAAGGIEIPIIFEL